MIYGSKREEVTGIWRLLYNDELHDVYTPNIGDHIKEDEMTGNCNKYGREEKCVQGFDMETWRKETTWKT